MKRLSLLILAVVVLAGCAGMSRRPAEVIEIPPGGVAVLNKIPAPRAGLVPVINPNEGADANCDLFPGHRTQEDIIGIGRDGNPVLNEQPLVKFTVGSAQARDFWTYKALVLQPYSRYTLFVIWTRFTGQVLDFHTIQFDTSGSAFRSYHRDPLGRKVFADLMLYLPHVDTRGVSQLRIHKTLYLGDWIKALFGF